MKCGVWVDVGAVGVCFVNDEPGYVGENGERVVFGKSWDVYYCGC